MGSRHPVHHRLRACHRITSVGGDGQRHRYLYSGLSSLLLLLSSTRESVGGNYIECNLCSIWAMLSRLPTIQVAPISKKPHWAASNISFFLWPFLMQDMLEYWLITTNPSARISVAKVMDKAAEKLKCKYANGRSVVTYGIPIYRKKWDPGEDFF